MKTYVRERRWGEGREGREREMDGNYSTLFFMPSEAAALRLMPVLLGLLILLGCGLSLSMAA